MAETKFVENIKNSDWCIAGYKQHYKDNKIIQKLPIKQLNENKYTLEEFSEVFENLYLSGFINSPWAKCYRKELITTFFDSKLFLGEDLICNLNYLKNCKNIKYTNSAVYNYIIQDEGSLSSDLKEQSFEVIYEVYKESKRILSGMFEHEHMWKKAVSQKFTIDMLVLVERGIRSGKIINYESMKQIIKKYEIRRLSNGIDSMIYGLKWRVILYFLENKNYKCIYMFFVLIFKVKKLRRK